jgi:uncharacterized membrane protein
MDIFVDLLFWIHLASLGLAGAAVFGLPVVGSRMASATPEMRPSLFAIADGLSRLGRAALGLLIVTGPLMVWLKFNGDMMALGAWFWVKMALVVILIVIVVYAGINGKRAQSGDMAAARRAPQIGMAGMVVYLLVIGAAVLTFR